MNNKVEMKKVEPVAWFDTKHGLPYGWTEKPPTENAIYLYTHPQDRDSIIEECAAVCVTENPRMAKTDRECAAAIRALKEKK